MLVPELSALLLICHVCRRCGTKGVTDDFRLFGVLALTCTCRLQISIIANIGSMSLVKALQHACAQSLITHSTLLSPDYSKQLSELKNLAQAFGSSSSPIDGSDESALQDTIRLLVYKLSIPSMFRRFEAVRIYEPEQVPTLQPAIDAHLATAVTALSVLRQLLRRQSSLRTWQAVGPAASSSTSELAEQQSDVASAAQVDQAAPSRRSSQVPNAPLTVFVMLHVAKYDLEAGQHPWCSRETIRLAQEILAQLVLLHGCDHIGRLLHQYWTPLLELLRYHLRGVVVEDRADLGHAPGWKQCVFSRHVIRWLIEHMHAESIGEHVNDLLSLVLPLLDDHEVQNKALGAHCLLLVVRQTAPSRWVQHGELLVQVSPVWL